MMSNRVESLASGIAAIQPKALGALPDAWIMPARRIAQVSQNANLP